MGEEIQLTYLAVGRNLQSNPIVNLPENIQVHSGISKIPEINFNPTFSPTFAPQMPPLEAPKIEVQVQPTPVMIDLPKPQIQVNVPAPNITIERPMPINLWYVSLILFANSLIFASLLFAINFYFYGF